MTSTPAATSTRWAASPTPCREFGGRPDAAHPLTSSRGCHLLPCRLPPHALLLRHFDLRGLDFHARHEAALEPERNCKADFLPANVLLLLVPGQTPYLSVMALPSIV